MANTPNNILVYVSITDDDIKHGVRLDCTSCPVSRCISRSHGGHFENVCVDPYCMSLQYKGDWYECDTPPALTSFIHAFDDTHHGPVTPPPAQYLTFTRKVVYHGHLN